MTANVLSDDKLLEDEECYKDDEKLLEATKPSFKIDLKNEHQKYEDKIKSDLIARCTDRSHTPLTSRNQKKSSIVTSTVKLPNDNLFEEDVYKTTKNTHKSTERIPTKKLIEK